MTLFTWFGKSDRPVPTTRAPAARASSGKISGVGLAMANTMASSAMETTMSGVMTPGAETPMTMSAPSMASASVPDLSSRFVTSSIARWASFMPS